MANKIRSMDRITALTLYFPYSPFVLRDGNVHKIALADLQHPEWNTKLLLRKLEDPICPGTLYEASGFIEGLKQEFYDTYGLLDSGIALPYESYAIPDKNI